MLKHQERYEERAKASVCDHWGLALVAGLTGAFVGESQADVIKIESFEMKSPAGDFISKLSILMTSACDSPTKAPVSPATKAKPQWSHTDALARSSYLS